MRLTLARVLVGALVLAAVSTPAVQAQAGWRYSYNGHRYWAGNHDYGRYYRRAAHLVDYSVAGTAIGAANLSATYGYNDAYPSLYEGVPPASAYSYRAIPPAVAYHLETREVTVPVVTYHVVSQTQYVPVTTLQPVTTEVAVPVTTYQTVQQTAPIPEAIPPATCRCSY
jgi:hypothetical protein